MNDDKRKPPRDNAGRGRPRDSERAPYKKAEGGAGKPFRKREEGDARPFRAREDGDRKPYQGRPDGDRKPFRKREEGDARPFRAREDGDRKPYQGRPDGERKPFRKREEGDARPFRAREDGDRKPYQGRPDGERKPFRKREEGDARPFRAREDGDRKSYQGRPDGDRKPFRKREEGDARPGRRERDTGATEPVIHEDGERIARRLARVGIASRRDAEDIIAAGRVRLNGKVLDTPAVNVGPNDRIEVDGQLIPAVERTRVFLFHKPAGVVTTNRDPEGRTTVFDVLPQGLPRLMTVGRLDINTEGLLLLTNDGGLSRVLELPTTGWLRRYRVRVHGKVDQAALDSLKDGIAVDGVFYGAVEATLDREQGSNAWLMLGLREGKNREVKNILGAIGLEVTRLIRVSFGPFQLGELREGEVRELKGRLLREQLGDRLIEEAGANFEAPILKEFTNDATSVVKQQVVAEERSEFRPNRKREREEKRESALDRLQTRPKRPDGSAPRPGPKREGGPKWDSNGPKRDGGGKFGKREERPVESPRPRNANVWMAPGARPVGEKKAAVMAERSEGRRYAGKPRPAGPARGKDGGWASPAPKGPRKPRDRS
ncbi:pseudouridine synthase [Aerobium aerolatum]|uniref:Pseudouridine synthase n=1 Tax=Aquamicrobium aerolatum DSM 21857 TaxID=1121003 RepID=A0A1I3HH45_9HYPH|nr:pseudouridine synthase [Aquamicrobium aerolatum]SFI34939.1 23S rRNA pseudouridine2605 synthase [Aquamicrobium aerolatum DSM 21857]